MALVDTTTAVPSRELSHPLPRIAQDIFENRAPVYLPVGHLSDATVDNIHNGLSAFAQRATPEERKRWCLQINRRPGQGADDGFIDRSDETRAADRKMYLHFRPELPRLLREHGVTVIDPWRAWLDECKHAYDLLQASVCELARTMDAIDPQYHLYERIRDAESMPDSSVLRILRYDMGSSGYTAAHLDQSCLTLHVRSSEPSLYFELDGKKVRHPEPGTHEVIAFPSLGLERATEGRVLAAKHGSEPSTRREYRWVIVYFATAAE